MRMIVYSTWNVPFACAVVKSRLKGHFASWLLETRLNFVQPKRMAKTAQKDKDWQRLTKPDKDWKTTRKTGRLTIFYSSYLALGSDEDEKEKKAT